MMSKDLTLKAKKYILTTARAIDRNIYLFEFENKSESSVFQELKHYQNNDGGFGHGLEPDIRMSQSSAIATTIAFQYLNQIKENLPEAIVKSAIDYFIQTVQEFPEGSKLKYYWNSLPSDIYLYQHAPWWNNENIEPTLANWPNPSVEIIGYLNEFSKFVPKEFIYDLNKDLEAFLDNCSALDGYYFYKFLCFKRIINFLPEYLQKKVFLLFDRTFSNQDTLTDEKLDGVKVQKIVTEKSSYLYQKFPKKIDELINNEINRLGNDGGSHPSWKWGDNIKWTQVEKEWTGKLTFELLSTLKYCDLLEM